MTKPGYEKAQRRAIERLDVLEDARDLPRDSCMVEGCVGRHVEAMAGPFGTRWLCSQHRSRYRVHDQIVRRIEAIPSR